jgi:sialate O-acetylesterase
MRLFIYASAILAIVQSARASEQSFRLASPFSDNMVLQQKSAAPFWGRGTPGSHVVLRASWRSEASALVDSDGTWRLSIRTPSAGGPYTVDVHHGDSLLTIHNVLVGEVWLCSGQSNMEMPLEGWPPDSILRSSEEISNSLVPGIRLYSVKRAYAPEPESRCEGTWEECSPATSHGFSAAAYFFGRRLHEVLHVPIGLINATWGGTPVQAWTQGSFLARVPEFDTTLQKIRLAGDGIRMLQRWLETFPVINVNGRERGSRWQNLDFQDQECASAAYADSTWHLMRLPTLWEKTPIGEFDGTIWFRKSVTIPSAWLHRDLILELGPVDDMDVTCVNGHSVGRHETEGYWKVDRIYRVPKDIVDTTLLCVAVRVVDNGGGGGIYGEEKSMSIHPDGQDERVSLAGDWKFLPVAEYRGSRFYVFGARGEKFYGRPVLPLDFSPYTPTALYNGMIAPLVPFPLAGVIWYQGESNVSAPALYSKLFPLMIENWRSAFRSDRLPFYFVQIAPFEYGPASASQFLRESQTGALRLPNTGMAVTLDIGNPSNIHPANKQEVGRRLALWALAKNYGMKLVYSGPLYRSGRVFKDRIELSFDNAGKGLVVTQTERGNGFQIAGEDRVFRDAEVSVKNNRLVVSHPAVKNPRAVRYAFTNSSRATFFNSEGLPAPSFRTDGWDH